jgi:hypothetical protein
VLPEAEDEREWEAFRDGIYESLCLEGALEYLLAERVALALWKLRRLEYYQNFATIHRMGDAILDLTIAAGYLVPKGQPPRTVTEEQIVHAKQVRVLPEEDTLNLIMRYNSQLHRQYIQTLHELEAMQARRRGERTPLARLDIASAPGGS